MAAKIDRRTFVRQAVLASATSALALGGEGGSPATAPPPATGPAPAESALPRGKIGDLQVSRLLLGGNLLTHYTHSRDLKYVYTLVKHYNTEEKIFETLAAAEAHGINTLVIHTAPNAIQLLKKYRRQGGKIQWIVCPTAPLDETLAGYTRQVHEIIDDGVDAVYLWGVRSDALVAEGKIDLLTRAVETARAQGVPSGVGAHELAVVRACEEHRVPADFYLKTLHHHSYPSATLNYDSLWCREPEETGQFMSRVEKPWIAFKVMAAGAIPPEDAFRHAFTSGADFVLAGMFDFEIAADVRIAGEILRDLGERNRPWRA